MRMLVYPTQKVLSSATHSNKIYCCSFLVKKLVICVPTTLAKCILFHNHMNKKVVGGRHNVLVQYMNAYALDSSGVVLWNLFKWDILLFILIENHVVCVPSTTVQWLSFCNHRYRKAVGGKHNVLVLYVNASAPESSCVVLCNTFKRDILLCVHIILNP